MAERAAEYWRPPLFAARGGRRQRLSAALRRYLDLQAGSIWNDLAGELASACGVVLDVGCGAQPYRELLPPEATYIGIDTAEAKAHFGYEMPDTRYFTGTTWPVADGSVDWILCTETLEHIPEPREFLAEACRCARPGGKLLLTVPFAARWHFIPYDYWRFTPSCLQRLLTEAGFENVAVYARGNALTVACYKDMALILPLLMPQSRSGPAAWGLRLIGLLCLPLLLCLAVVANFSLRGEGGDDCLGYTVVAERAGDPASSQMAAIEPAADLGAPPCS
jgi:SAM-dependent methyltransferase